ncbi:hypothetical protein B0H12DRAFT_1157917, partial [Mycena haematopus]
LKAPSSTLRHRPIPISFSASTPQPTQIHAVFVTSTSHMQPYANPRPHRPNCPSRPTDRPTQLSKRPTKLRNAVM